MKTVREKTGESLVKTARRIIPMLFRAAPGLTAVSLVFVTLRSLLQPAVVVGMQVLFDAVTLAGSGQSGFRDCAVPLLVLTVIFVAQEVNDEAFWFTNHVLYGKCIGKFTATLFEKLQRVDPASYERPEFLDDINKARTGIFTALYFSQFIFIILLNYGLYFVVIGAYLFSLRPILVVMVAVSFIPALMAQIFRAKIFARLEEKNAPLRRENEYYQKALCDREYFKETRILGAFFFFRDLFSDTLAVLTRKTWQAERKTSLLQLLLSVTSFAGLGFSIYLLYTTTMAGDITVGTFVAALSAVDNIFGSMRSLVANHLRKLSRDFGKVYNFLRLLDMPEVDGPDGEAEYAVGVRAEHVSFTYPGREETAVKDVSLTIAGGETIAIVGENGAGKSTLVRLLTGVYRPDAGRVSIGGLDTLRTAPRSLYHTISGVFQKYQRYKMILSENVAISDTRGEADPERISAALTEADAELGDGIGSESMLSPEFDGVDLSGGQWQRLAIARGLYRKNGFIVLDEPTSAIDPIEETRMYTQFQKLAAGKCAIVVTHRLGSAKLAHRIIVMDGGRIVDAGTHEELLSRPGKYADMWAAQAKWYER